MFLIWHKTSKLHLFGRIVCYIRNLGYLNKYKVLNWLSTKEGWVFDPKNGTQIQGKYIFGEKTSINENELTFSLSEKNMQTNEMELDESIIVVVIITIISIGAALFYLKGYKK